MKSTELTVFRPVRVWLSAIFVVLMVISGVQLPGNEPTPVAASDSNAPVSQTVTSITGRLTDEVSGDPIVGARVQAEPDQCCDGRDATTDQDGNYEITGLTAGVHIVRTSAFDLGYVDEFYDDSIGWNDRAFISVTEGETNTGIDFALLQGGSISGTVFEPGGTVPLSDVWVNVYSQTHDTWMEANASTDSSGNYVLSGVPAGQVKVEFNDHSGNFAGEFYNDSPGFSSAELVQIAGTQSVTGIDAVLDPAGSISGTVLAPGGVDPVEDLTVAVLDPFTHDWIRSGRTDPSGNYRIEGLRSGDYKVLVLGSEQGFIDQYFDGSPDFELANIVEVMAPDDAPDINFTLDLGGSISGHVYEADGVTPIADIHVFAVDIAADTWTGGANTDVDGFYSLVLPAGDYEVRACPSCSGPTNHLDEVYLEAALGEDPTPVTVVVPDNTPDINFTLDLGGSISGHVYEADGVTPIADIHVFAVDIAADTWTGGANTDVDGFYALALPAGDYEVRACPSCSGPTNLLDEVYLEAALGEDPTPVTVVVPDNTPDIDFTLDLAASISGTVLAPGGFTPVEDLTVAALDPFTHDWIESARTDASGNYRIEGLRSGDYKVWALGSEQGFVDQYFDGSPEFDLATIVGVTAPDDTPDIDFTMTFDLPQPTVFVERSVDEHNPVPGQEVTVTLTPTGISSFYAVREDLDGLELVSHDADSFDNGVFINITPSPITYVARVPENAVPGDLIFITGRFWEDPGSEISVAPSQTVLQITAPLVRLDREISAASGNPGDIIDITLTPSEISQFYAAKEILDGLELVSHDADDFQEGAFIRLTNAPIHYQVRIPAAATQGSEFKIFGTFWENPGQTQTTTPFVSEITVTNANSSVSRTLSSPGADAGQTVTVTVTPTGISQFYTVRENLGGLQLVSHTADDFFDGAFVQLTPALFEYTVSVPTGVPAGTRFNISGSFWEDPNSERLVDPEHSSLLVTGGPSSTVTRSLSAEEALPGETVTVTLTPDGVAQFYAVRENLNGLELISQNADDFFADTFVMLTPRPIEYVVRVPANTSPGATIAINGVFWEDPGALRIVDPAQSLINVPGTPPSSVHRSLSAAAGPPGGTITVTISPTDVELFYAVRENLGGLELVGHTADVFDNGVFVMLTPEPFEYTVRVPGDANEGAQFNISGVFWEDPGVEFPVEPAVSRVSVLGPPDSSVERTLSATNTPPGETLTVTLTPTDVNQFYAVREHLDGLELVEHTADGLQEGVFIMLTPTPFEYTVRVPAGADKGDQFRVSGIFWEDPGLELPVDPAESIVVAGSPATVERDLGSRTAVPGEQITITLTPDGVDLFYAVEENLDGLELQSHDADNFENGIFIRLGPDPIHYTVRVPVDALDEAEFNITGEFWEDPGFRLRVSPAISQIRVATTPSTVERIVSHDTVDAGDLVTVTITPANVDQFYAVREQLGGLELVEHTADGLQEGVFIMLTPTPFEYTVRVPSEANEGDQFPISGTFWEDPEFARSVTPLTTTLTLGQAIGLSFVPAELPLDLNDTGTVELHVDDLLGETVDTVQLKITHDPAVVEISNPSCIGIFAGGQASTVIRDESAGASWFNCSLAGGSTGDSGQVMSFDVTRTGPGNPVLEMTRFGTPETAFFDKGQLIQTPVRPLNVLQILPNTTVSGTVTIQGVAPGDEQAFAVIGPHVSLVPISGGRATGVDVNPDGSFAVRGVLDGVYDVILDAPGSLGRLLPSLIVSGNDIHLEPIQLRGGISNPDDDIVEGRDISAVVGFFGLGPSDLNGRFAPGTDLIVDFNGDGWVSAFDISIVLSNMGERRLQEWSDPAVGP